MTEPGHSPPTHKPRRGELDRPTILKVGLAIADEHGLDAVTIRAISERIGLTQMSLYRHVESKDDILAGLTDLAWDALDAQPDPDHDWRDQLATVFTQLHRTLLEHPGLLEILLARPSWGRPVFRTIERLLRLLREAGFSDEDALFAIILLESVSLGFTVQQRIRRDRTGVDDLALSQPDADEFPNLSSAVRLVPGWASEDNFARALKQTIAGLEPSR